MSAPNKRSVRFNESQTDQPPQKRSRPANRHQSSEEARKPSALRPSSHTVKIKDKYRANTDELDDIDDWNEREDGDREGDLPSKSELIEAKRKRREQRGANSALFNNDDDHLDENETSLATDGVKIEPFHMKEEETDGTGYFDGDTYVFRKNTPTEDGEADAWADTLMRDGNGETGDDNEDRQTIGIARNAAKKNNEESSALQEDMDGLSKEELNKRIVRLMDDPMESIMQAIQRCGKLAKPKFNSKNRRKNQKLKQHQQTDDKDSDKTTNVAKSHLDDLTGAANALLLKGEVDIYDRKKQDILRMYPSLSEQRRGNSSTSSTSIASVDTSKPKWEYQGNEDNQLHGPYTTEQMIGWVRAGYFVGAQRVKIRTVCLREQAEEKKAEPELSTQDDLLADLMDDDDEEEEESRPAKKAKDSSSTITIKGEWMWSNEVNYQNYI